MFKKLRDFFVFYRNYIGIGDKTKEDMTRFYIANTGGLTASTVAVSVYLSGFAIFVGAGDTLSSIISSMNVYSFLPMFLSPLIFERLSRRRSVICLMQIIGYILLCGLVLIPLFAKGAAAGFILLFVTVIGIILYGMVTAGTNVWVMEIVPLEHRGEYFAKREILDKIITCIVVFTLGLVLDFFNRGYAGFLIIYSLCFVFALVQYYQLRKITDVEYKLAEEKTKFSDLITIPLRSKTFRNLTFYIAVFFFIAWLCYSFRNIFMLKYIEISYMLYSVLFSFRMIVQGLVSPLWGRMGIKKGWYAVFIGCLVCFSLEYISWSFVTKNAIWMLFVSHAFSGIANSGLVLSTLNLRFNSMPSMQKSVYEGFYNMFVGLGCILGPLVGNLLRVNMPVFSGDIFPDSQIRLVFIVSFIANSLLILYLYLNKKKYNDIAVSK
jgi:MFS family permease